MSVYVSVSAFACEYGSYLCIRGTDMPLVPCTACARAFLKALMGQVELFQRKLARWESKVTRQLVKLGELQQGRQAASRIHAW